MSEIWNLSTLCRCCHADGHFKSLKLSYEGENDVEIYEIMLCETLGISISTPSLEASYTICENCITKLRDATNFKNQVLLCEEKFKVYCQNEQFLAVQDVKIEENDDISNGDDDDLRMDTDNFENIDVEVKKEYSIEVDIKHPIEELKNEKSTEEEDIIETKVSNAVKKTSSKKGSIIKKNIKTEPPHTNLDRSLIVEVKTDTGTQFTCKDCGGDYPNKKQINRHIYLNHSPSYKCEYCEKQLKTYYIYKRHLQKHLSKEFQCPHCEKKFSEKTALNNHINTHTKQKEYVCDLCHKHFMNKQILKRHLRLHYGTNKKELCYLCGKSFNDISNLESHIRSVHEKLRPFECKECGKTYSTKRHLRDHLKMHESVKSGSLLHKCDICGYMLVNARLMMAHRLKHDNKFMCHVCQVVFDSSQARRDHLKAEHQQVFRCPICGKVLLGKFSLNRHINDHKGIKKFACELCGMQFSQKSGLKRHNFRKHNPEADFEQDKTKCDICKRRFKNIAVHIDRHHNNRIACDICGKTYADNSALNRHKAQKHFGRTFDCEVCGKKYLQKTKLNTHRFKVHKIKIEVNTESAPENQTISVM